MSINVNQLKQLALSLSETLFSVIAMLESATDEADTGTEAPARKGRGKKVEVPAVSTETVGAVATPVPQAPTEPAPTAPANAPTVPSTPVADNVVNFGQVPAAPTFAASAPTYPQAPDTLEGMNAKLVEHFNRLGGNDAAKSKVFGELGKFGTDSLQAIPKEKWSELLFNVENLK